MSTSSPPKSASSDVPKSASALFRMAIDVHRVSKALSFVVLIGCIICASLTAKRRETSCIAFVTLMTIVGWHATRIGGSRRMALEKDLLRALWMNLDAHYAMRAVAMVCAGQTPLVLFLSYAVLSGREVAKLVDTAVAPRMPEDVAAEVHYLIRLALGSRNIGVVVVAFEISLLPCLVWAGLTRLNVRVWIALVVDVVLFLMFVARVNGHHMYVWKSLMRVVRASRHPVAVRIDAMARAVSRFSDGIYGKTG